jgi:hypothetical protein
MLYAPIFFSLAIFFLFLFTFLLSARALGSPNVAFYFVRVEKPSEIEKKCQKKWT